MIFLGTISLAYGGCRYCDQGRKRLVRGVCTYGVCGAVGPYVRSVYMLILTCSRRLNVAPLLSPVLGSAIDAEKGWRWIFWFLCILSGCCLALILCFLPETARNLVGNGDKAPSKIQTIPRQSQSNAGTRSEPLTSTVMR